MRRAFFSGAAIGTVVFLQALAILRLPIRSTFLEWWALAWSGVFGLTIGSTFSNSTQAVQMLAFAAVGLVVFYGLSAVALWAAYRSFRRIGAFGVLAIVVAIHVMLYLAVVKSVVA